MARGGQGQRRSQLQGQQGEDRLPGSAPRRGAGTLEYDNEQTRIHNLKASLWNQPLTLDYQGRQHPIAIRSISSSRGSGTAAASAGTYRPSRCSRAQQLVRYPGADPARAISFQLALDSNLQGMGLDLPARCQGGR
jgi:uncharacterized protein YhdP